MKAALTQEPIDVPRRRKQPGQGSAASTADIRAAAEAGDALFRQYREQRKAAAAK